MEISLQTSKEDKIEYGLGELTGNKKFQKLPGRRQRALIEEAVSIGEELADNVYAEFHTRDSRVIADRLGIRIEGEQKGGFGELKVFSSYKHKSRTIVIYRDSLALLFSRSQGIEPMKYLIAHELFHYYENEKNIEQKFNELNELSAHYFAVKLLSA
ncbi:hypothetical protein ACFLZ2_01635 [Candidatus Margulisiibacteriota bacterium]